MSLKALRLKFQFRHVSLKLEGDLQSLKLDARAITNDEEVATSLVELKRPVTLGKGGALARFQIDTLTHRPEVSARVVVFVAGLNVHFVRGPVQDLKDFFASPVISIDSVADDDGHRARLKKGLDKARHLSSELSSDARTDQTIPTNAPTRNTSAEIIVTLTKSCFTAPEEAEPTASTGEFGVTVDNLKVTSDEKPLLQPGMFNLSCEAAQEACAANEWAIQELRQRGACQVRWRPICDTALTDCTFRRMSALVWKGHHCGKPHDPQSTLPKADAGQSEGLCQRVVGVLTLLTDA